MFQVTCRAHHWERPTVVTPVLTSSWTFTTLDCAQAVCRALREVLGPQFQEGFIEEIQVLNSYRLSPTEIAVVRSLYTKGDKVLAIKLMRETTSCSLKEAKDFCDALYDAAQPKTPTTPTPEGVTSLGALLRSKINQGGN